MEEIILDFQFEDFNEKKYKYIDVWKWKLEKHWLPTDIFLLIERLKVIYENVYITGERLNSYVEGIYENMPEHIRIIVSKPFQKQTKIQDIHTIDMYSIPIVLFEITNSIEDYLMNVTFSFSALVYDIVHEKMYIGDMYRKNYLEGDIKINLFNDFFFCEDFIYNIAYKDIYKEYTCQKEIILLIKKNYNSENIKKCIQLFNKNYKEPFPFDILNELLIMTNQIPYESCCIYD